MLVSGSNEPPCQFVPPSWLGAISVPSGPSMLLTTGGVNSGPILCQRDDLERLAPQLRREVDEVVLGHALPVVRRRLGRERLRRRVPLAGHVALRHGPLLDRPKRPARHAIEHVEERLLRRLRDGFHGPAVDDGVEQDRRARDVEVPDAVMHELVVPLALAGVRDRRRAASR